VTVELSRGGKSDTSEFVVSAKGVFRSTGTEPKPEFQPAPGTSWTSGDDTTHTVGREEEVKVPAGTFKALPVVTVVQLPGGQYKYTTWFAPGVGVVKSVSPGQKGETVQVLMAFTPGK
jgi:hypothetical protein